MTRTVVALYDNFQDANAAVRELVDNGFNRDDISLMAGDQAGEYGRHLGATGTTAEAAGQETTSGAGQGAGIGAGIGAALGGIGGLLVGLGALVIPGVGPVIAAGPLAAALAGLAGAGAGALAGGVTGGLIGALVDIGVPEETAQYYTEGVRRGGTLLTVRTDDNMSGRAVNIMNRHHPVDINSRAAQWRESGWTGMSNQTDVTRDQESTGTFRGVVDENQPASEKYQEDQNIPATGDRAQQPGGSVTGPSGQQDYSTGGVSSQNLRTDDVRGQDLTTQGFIGQNDMVQGANYDSTRMSDRGMSGPDTGARGEYRDFGYYDAAFHNHFNGFYGTNNSYEQYRPYYRYGYDLASDPRYADRTWQDVEPEAQRYWNEREPGAWDRVKDAVRHAWDEVKNAAS